MAPIANCKKNDNRTMKTKKLQIRSEMLQCRQLKTQEELHSAHGRPKSAICIWIAGPCMKRWTSPGPGMRKTLLVLTSKCPTLFLREALKALERS
jgi:hypothetical protein